MKLKISDLKTERQWRSATGFDQARFEKLLVMFTASYLSLHGKSVAERQADIEVTPSLTSEEELLFFTLFSLKAGLTYDLLGLVCGMDASNAKRNQELGLRVLEQALAAAGCLPKRGFKDAAEFAEYLKNEKTLIFDGTEQRTQRPSDNEAQKENYSGKKKPTPPRR
ncbi:transposase [bacterium]|nr:transposase [bacterium]